MTGHRTARHVARPSTVDHRWRRFNRLVAVSTALAVVIGLWAVIPQRAVGSASSTPVNFTVAQLAKWRSAATSSTRLVGSNSRVTAAELRRVPNAPASFRGQVDALYGSMYAAIEAAPRQFRASRTMTPSVFDAKVNQMSAKSLGLLYRYARSRPTFFAVSHQLDATLPAERLMARTFPVRSASRSPRGAVSSTRAVAHDSSGFSAQQLTQIPPSMPQTGSFGGGTSNSGYAANWDSSCPSALTTSVDPWGEVTPFAMQIVLDVIGADYNAGSNFGELYIGVLIDVALLLAATIVQQTAVWFKAIYNDCEANNLAAVGVDIDNSTYQTYQLLTAVAGTANEADQSLVNLINQNAANYELQLRGVIEQDLTQPANSAPMASLELPATSGGYLDSSPVGVASVVTTALTTLQQAGQLNNPQAERYLGLAQQAYSAAQYKLAFNDYRLAYQAATL